MIPQPTNVQIFDRNYQVFGYPGEGWYDILVNSGKYTEFNLENLRQFIRPDFVCLDIGANVGVMTLAMKALVPDGVVHSFEGSDATYKALRETVRASGFSQVKTYPWIVGREGEYGVFVDDVQWRSSSHYMPGDGETRARSIDSLELDAVDFIKIDVEGGELDVLDGMLATLKRCQPIVVMEFNSFAMIHYREIIPRHMLKRIFEIFPKVYYFQNRNGGVVKLDDPEAFLKSNMFGGFVDDLICGWAGD